ncbi:MAG: hypothetical protein V3R16_09580 [Nitrospirales bacterium]
MNSANFEIVERDKYHVVLRDLGPWDERLTITNDAPAVVQDLVSDGTLAKGAWLFYYDSAGDLDEIIVTDGRFAGFRAGAQSPTPPRRSR